MSPGPPTDVDRVAATVRAVPGVVDLHAGAAGEAVTLLPGRRVAGIRTGADGTEVHIAVAHGAPMREVADAVRAAVHAVATGPVTVVVEDVVTPEPSIAPAVAAPAAEGSDGPAPAGERHSHTPTPS